MALPAFPLTRVISRGRAGACTDYPSPHTRPPAASPLQQHVSCQNKLLGEGTAEVEPSARETPATNPKQTLRAPPGPRRGSVRLLKAGRGSQARWCPFPEPGWWEAARRAVAGTAPARCKQRPSGSDPAASRARSPRPPGHPSWLLGARAPLPRGTAVRRQTRGQGGAGFIAPRPSPLAPASLD